MAVFVYEGLDAARQVVTGKVDAASREEAIEQIRKLGHFPTKLTEQGGRDDDRTA